MKVEMRGGPQDGEVFPHVRPRRANGEQYMTRSVDGVLWLVPIRLQYSKASNWKYVAVWDMKVRSQ